MSRKDIIKHGGRNLFDYYSSLDEALRSVYPDHPWDDLYNINGRVPRGYWDDTNNAMGWLNKIALELGIQQARVLAVFLLGSNL